MERTLLNSRPVQCVRMEGSGPKLTGYAAVYYRENEPGTEYKLYGNVRERIMPGAFDGMRDAEVISTFNHDPNQLLGRSTSGTFRWSLDEVGVAYEIDLPDTQLGRDVATLAERGDLDGSSFWFDFPGSKYNKRSDENGEVWELVEVAGLVEMGPVTSPAYKSTSAFKRSQSAIREAIEREQQKNTTNRLRLLSKTV